jgi:predicted component of type VI protein secretion system
MAEQNGEAGGDSPGIFLKLIVKRGQPAGKSLLFSPGDYYLGRGPECQVRFTSDWVSRQHCLLHVDEHSAVLRDLGSRNGTLVNGQLIQQDCSLVNGDRIQVGPVVFEVRLESRLALNEEDVLWEDVRLGSSGSHGGDAPQEGKTKPPERRASGDARAALDEAPVRPRSGSEPGA